MKLYGVLKQTYPFIINHLWFFSHHIVLLLIIKIRSSIFNLLRKLCTVFCSDYTDLHSHQHQAHLNFWTNTVFIPGFPCPGPKHSHFSKNPSFLLVRNSIQKPRFGHQVCLLLLGCDAHRPSQWTEICTHIPPPHTHMY